MAEVRAGRCIIGSGDVGAAFWIVVSSLEQILEFVEESWPLFLLSIKVEELVFNFDPSTRRLLLCFLRQRNFEEAPKIFRFTVDFLDGVSMKIIYFVVYTSINKLFILLRPFI